MAALPGIDALLAEQEGKDLLRFITCGSVDDGKSTLIGRMLFESRMIFSDQLAALEEDSRKFGTTGGEPDFALLVDGLAAEREQGITIDVAYRFFATGRRRFIVADTPGHEQYTRNMATGASTADAAVLMVDARKGLLPQTRRHSFIVSMMGVRQVILAVNKMDLAGYAQEVFDGIVADYAAVAERLGIASVTPVPVSALKGDNVVETSGAMPWYKGPPLMRILEAAEPRGAQEGAFRMPVQRVSRPDDAFRGFAGRIAAGTVAPGDSVVILPSGHAARVKEVVTYDGPLEAASAGRSVTLTLAEEVDVARGDVIAAADAPCATARHFAARLIWMSEAPMVPSRQYILQSGTARAFCTPGTVKSRVDVNTLAEIPGRPLKLNEIGACNIALDRDIAFAPYAENRTLGAFILVDRVSHETVAAGMIDYALRRATNVQAQDITVTPAERAALKGQKPFVVWFTGLSGAGKSSTADELEKALHAMGRHTMLLDGDNIRLGLNNNLGFTPEDRAENIRRIAEVAKLMSSAGLITLTSFISPYRADRETARRLIGAEGFVEVFVDVPLEVAEQRDPKGLYKKARAGEIPNFTGIGAPYEAPENPQVHLRADTKTPRDMAQDVIAWLEKNGYL